jgi:hypothetical protein
LKGDIIIMKKWGKGLMGLAAAGGAIAGLIYYLKKKDSCEDDDFDDDFEDDDFDLDSDLKPVSDREYVSLNPSAKSEEADEEASGEAAAEDAEPEETDSADADED